jgi:ATPase subunit of ABC transporter with duplicated ATPase domains
MLVARDLGIEVGERRLLSGASVTLQPGDKVGLVGRNGAGKTSLLRTLAGELVPAVGAVLHRGRLGFLAQENRPAAFERENGTALERILAAREIGALQRGIEEARRTMGEGTEERRDRAIRRFAHLHDQFESRGGYAAQAEALSLANSLGITTEELARPLAVLSGGERRRVELAGILFGETDALLLDEPTNHLDLDAKAWLMDFLAGYRGALLLVSHDLPLLDQSITSVLSLEDGALQHYRGNHSSFVAERERRREQRLKERRHQEARIVQLETTVRRFVGTTEKMARRAKAMQTRADRMRSDLVEVGKRGPRVTLRFPQPEPSGRTPLRASRLAKAYGDNLVFLDVDVELDRGERLLIMGLNGAGKTTLLRILAGVERPDLGEVDLGYRVSVGYYAQEHEQVVAGMTALQHLREVSTAPDAVLRSVLGHFLLGDRTAQDAATLSGGEKTKLVLACLVVGRHNVLLLDEPTNNLDPQAKEALLGALRQYQGTLVLVSHDIGFVEALSPDRALLMPEGRTAYFDESLLELVALA